MSPGSHGVIGPPHSVMTCQVVLAMRFEEYEVFLTTKLGEDSGSGVFQSRCGNPGLDSRNTT